MKVRTTLMTVIGMLLVAVSACGSSAGVPTVTTALSVVDENLVQLEAQWMCDVQRHAYAELSDMDTARRALMAAFDVAPAVYDEFKARIQSDASLRSHVSATFLSTCATPGGTT